MRVPTYRELVNLFLEARLIRLRSYWATVLLGDFRLGTSFTKSTTENVTEHR